MIPTTASYSKLGRELAKKGRRPPAATCRLSERPVPSALRNRLREQSRTCSRPCREHPRGFVGAQRVRQVWVPSSTRPAEGSTRIRGCARVRSKKSVRGQGQSEPRQTR